jgi:hypothetical protein
VFARVSCRKPKSATTSTATTNGRVATFSGNGGAGTNNVNHGKNRIKVK